MIDTNILIDYIMNREPYAEIDSEIVMMCAEKKIDGYIAAHSFPNIFFILRKSLSSHDRRNILKSLFTIFSVESIDREKLLSALDNDLRILKILYRKNVTLHFQPITLLQEMKKTLRKVELQQLLLKNSLKLSDKAICKGNRLYQLKKQHEK